jgi:hypothetical protein
MLAYVQTARYAQHTLLVCTNSFVDNTALLLLLLCALHECIHGHTDVHIAHLCMRYAHSFTDTGARELDLLLRATTQRCMLRVRSDATARSVKGSMQLATVKLVVTSTA